MELTLSDDLGLEFEQVLRHCLIGDAVRVSYRMTISRSGSHSSLKYYDRNDRPIGDDRPYDILKSCFNRLTGLSERLIEKCAVEDDLSIETLMIDLDLVSGHMSVSGHRTKPERPGKSG